MFSTAAVLRALRRLPINPMMGTPIHSASRVVVPPPENLFHDLTATIRTVTTHTFDHDDVERVLFVGEITSAVTGTSGPVIAIPIPPTALLADTSVDGEPELSEIVPDELPPVTASAAKKAKGKKP